MVDLPPADLPPIVNTDPFDAATRPELYEGVLSKRVVAFCVDAVLVFLLMIPAFIIVTLLGVLTFGLAWLLYPALFAIVALGYVAFTMGGPKAATPGMRMAGIELRMLNGSRPFPVLAAVHALIFWFSMTVLTPLILLVGLFSSRARLLQDLLLNTVVLNSRYLRPGE